MTICANLGVEVLHVVNLRVGGMDSPHDELGRPSRSALSWNFSSRG